MFADDQRGFTLIEVMVALTVAALALVAVMASISQMVDASIAMRDRTYASWVAQNKIAELRLANVQPEVSETSGEVTFAAGEMREQDVVQIQLPIGQVILRGILQAPEVKPLVARIGRKDTVLEPRFSGEDLVWTGSSFRS